MDTDDVPVEHGENASESAVQSLLLLSSTLSQKSSSPIDDERKDSSGSPEITTRSASSSSRREGIPEDYTVPNFSGMLPIPHSMEAFVNGTAGLSNNGFVVVPQHFVTNGGMNNHPPGFFIPIHSSFGAAASGPSSLLLQRSLSSEVGEYMMTNRPKSSSNSNSSSSSSSGAAAAGNNAPTEKKFVLFEGLKAMQAKEFPVNEMLFARSLALQYHDSSSNLPPCDGSTDNVPVGHLDFLAQQQQQQQQQQDQQQPQQQQMQFMYQNQMQSRAHATHDDASGNNSISSSSSKKRLNSGTSSVQTFEHEYGAAAAAAGSGMGKKHRGSDISLGSLNFSGKSFTSLSSGFHMGANMNFFAEGVSIYDPLGQGGSSMFALDTRGSGMGSGSMSLGGSLGGLSDSTKQLVSGTGLMPPPMPTGDRGMLTLQQPPLSRPSYAAAASSSSSNIGTGKVLSFGPVNGRKSDHGPSGLATAIAAAAVYDNNNGIGTSNSKLKLQKTSAERYRQRNTRRKQSFSSKLARVVSMLRLWVKRPNTATGASAASSSSGTGGADAAGTARPLAAGAAGVGSSSAGAGGVGSSSSSGGMHLSSGVTTTSSRPEIPPPGEERP